MNRGSDSALSGTNLLRLKSADLLEPLRPLIRQYFASFKIQNLDRGSGSFSQFAHKLIFDVVEEIACFEPSRRD